jgi:pimeloyl-ACP methyl ester carboxylesterase
VPLSHRRLCLVAFAAFAAVAQAQQTPPGRLQLAQCTLPGLTHAARCGALEVPEDPARSGGRRLSIGIAVIPARESPAQPDPIAVLMGGPGEDAVSAAAILAAQFAPLLRDRDLLLVDHRGSGRSHPLNCDLFAGEEPAAALRDLYPPRGVERCVQQLRARADLAQYTVVRFAGDLEQVRRALGYGPLNLTAGSYGTRAAQVYVRTYPRSVRSVHLASAVPIDVPPPLTMAKSAQASLEQVFRDCAADPACRRAFPDLRAEFSAVAARLTAGSARVTVPGATLPAVLDRGRVAEWLRSRLYRPNTAAEIPWLIHRAYEGDWQPIADGILAYAAAFHSALSVGVFFSVTCSEDLAFVSDADIERETRGTFLGDYRVRQQRAACEHWPRAALPAGHRAAVRTSLPTLFVSGDTDAASPLWFTSHIARGFANRAEIVLAGRGHTEWSECLTGVYERFVRSADARGLDTASCTALARPPFRTQ